MFLSCGILMMAVGFYLTKKRSNLILLLIFITALLLTGKRGHLIFIIAALYLTYYFSLAGRKSATKLYKTLVVVVVAFITLFVIVNMIPSLSVISTRMQSALEGDDTSVIIRFELWEIAWKNFRQNPIFGIGWHQFLHTLSSAVGSNREFEVHNVYLQLLCETGADFVLAGICENSAVLDSTFLKRVYRIYNMPMPDKKVRISCFEKEFDRFDYDNTVISYLADSTENFDLDKINRLVFGIKNKIYETLRKGGVEAPIEVQKLIEGKSIKLTKDTIDTVLSDFEKI